MSNDAGAAVRQRKAARLQQEAVEEEAAEPQPVPDVGRRRGLVALAAEEARQRQQPVLPGLAGGAADGAAGLGRDIDELVGGAHGGAARQVEAIAELVEETELEADEDGRPDAVIAQRIEGDEERIMDARMRLALGQELEQRHQRGEAGEAQRIVHQRAGPERDGLEREAAEMILGAGPPARHHDIAGLEHRSHGARAAAAHQPRPAAAALRQHLGDGRGLAMGPDIENDALLGPFHRAYSSPIILSRSGSLAQFSRTLTNRNRCTGWPTASAISWRAAWPIALMVWPSLPSTILRCPSRST